MSSPAVAPYGAYRTADGHTVVLGTTNDREWQRLAREFLGRPDLADDERFRTNSGRVAHRDGPRRGDRRLVRAATTWPTSSTAPMPRASATRRYNTPNEVLAHPQLAARDRWREIDTPSGRSRAAAARR